ncbi:MAG: EF-P lysine aminoacylase EpmA [Methylovulum sp.]|nr:EF-P lysine aminoacylase EpmA [Methylovulum sp.]
MQTDWQPTCSLELLRLRARLFGQIREFFAGRGVLEVETPLLSQALGTDPQLAFFSTQYESLPNQSTLFLQTSPEFAMKRLLAAGSGSIYQICKAFRNGEAGRFHNPEFTLLEWYRVGFDLPQLMTEVDDLISLLFFDYGLQVTQRISYRDVFQQYTGLDPLVFSHHAYCAYALAQGIPEAVTICADDHALWLDFLFSHKVQPHLGKNALCMVYGYPSCQSSLARISPENKGIAERVELFIKGVELGNGYYELTDAVEQERRFNEEIGIRQQRKQPVAVKDERFLAALYSGLPDCSGMAIGLDRLLMLLSACESIGDTLSFSIHRA